MSTDISRLGGPRLGINSSADLLEKLKFDSTRLSRDWNVYAAYDFLITAWHLYHDWKQSDDSGTLSKTKRNPNKLPDEMRMVLDATRDLANGNKHFNLDEKAAKRRRVSATHTGDEVGYYEYFFHEDMPAVTIDDHWYFSIRVLRNIILRYFGWVFNDSVPANAFPTELLESIRYCNIAVREGVPPKTWCIDSESAFRKRTV